MTSWPPKDTGRGGEHHGAGPGRRSRSWWGFVAWLVVGAGYAVSLLSLLTIGFYLLVLSGLATLALLWRRKPRGSPGLIAGAGVPFLYVAYLNRSGPGTVCNSSGTTCGDEFTPWPFLIIGAALVITGLALQFRGNRR